MVKKSIIFFSPMYVIAISAALFFFVCNIQILPQVFVGSMVLSLVICISILTVIVERNNSQTISKFLLYVALGSLIGFSASASVFSQGKPLRTLAPTAAIKKIHGTCLSDPVKVRNSKYKIVLSTILCETSDGSTFSSKGKQTIFIDAEQITHNQVGGIGWQNSHVLSKNSIATFTGFLKKDSFGNTYFYASHFSIPPKDDVLAVSKMRSFLRLHVTRTLYDLGNSGGLLISLLTGNKDYIEDGLEQKFKNTGLAHILALSGMHLSLFSCIAIRMGSTIGGKKISIRFSLIAILFFLWFAGDSPSLIRASLLAILSIFSARSGYSLDLLKLLALTFIIQVLFRPLDIVSLGGILSYLALIGILLFTDSPQKLIIPYLPPFFSSPLFASVGALFATAPLQVLIFKQLPISALPATILISPLCLLFITIGIFHLGLSFFLPFSLLATKYILSFLYTLIQELLNFFSVFPVIPFNYLPVALLSAIMIPLIAIGILLRSTFLLSRRAPNAAFARL